MVSILGFKPSKIDNNIITSESVPFPLPSNIVISSHMILDGEVINQITCYLLDCSTTANFISDFLAKSLNLTSISQLDKYIQGLNGKAILPAIQSTKHNFWRLLHRHTNRQISTYTWYTMVLQSQSQDWLDWELSQIQG